MKRLITASIKLKRLWWTARYWDTDGKKHKVAAYLPTGEAEVYGDEEWEEVEEMFDTIIPEPYTRLLVHGTHGSFLGTGESLQEDGFEILEYEWDD